MTATQTLPFQAEVDQLLGLMVHSLYSHREIFLRELISNASDALDKLRILGLSQPESAVAGQRLAIRLEVEPARRILRVVDNGIGMSRQEVVENLGTIARSGTRRFLDALREQGGDPGSNLIGQFGVGFYSSFMVADRVVVVSAKVGSAGGTRWVSDGKGAFEVEDLERAPRGTSVELHLKAPSDDDGHEGEEALDFASPDVLARLVRRTSDFVEWPIEMAAAHFPERQDLTREKADDGLDVVVLNSRRPLWSRPKAEIKPEEYSAFYRHFTHAFDEPLETVHFRGEGKTEYTALLFVPRERPFDLFDRDAEKSHVALFVRHVFVMADSEALLPPWLRFVRGLVDSQDLPLNVSREILQQNRALGQIRARLVKKVLDALAGMRDERRADYEAFWSAFGSVLKEGILMESEQRQSLAELLLVESTHGEGRSTLAEVVARAAQLPEDERKILCLVSEDRAAAQRSPHVEAWKARGREVVFFTDAVDEWVLERLEQFGTTPLVRVDRGPAYPGGDAQRQDLEQREREERALLEALEARLSDRVQGVRFSGRLVQSPAALVDEEGSVGPAMERLMRHTGRPVPPRRRVLELNPEHAVVRRLAELARADASAKRVDDFAELLIGQALLSEGTALPDPVRFGALLNELMLAAV